MGQSQPTSGFTQFFITDAEFVHKVVPRFSPFSLTVMPIRRRSGSQQLICDIQTGASTFHRFRDADDSHGELQQSLFQIKI